MRKSLVFAVLSLLLPLLGCNSGGGGTVRIGNGISSLGFDPSDGRLVSFIDKATGYEYIDSSAVASLPWRLYNEDCATDFLGRDGKVSFKRRGRNRLTILWEYGGEAPLKVRMEVSLEGNRPISHWRAAFTGLAANECDAVSYPVVSGLKPYARADLLRGTIWMGSLVHDPADGATEAEPVEYTGRMPGGSAQLMALYDPSSRKDGVYLAAQDTKATVKSFTFAFTPSHCACRFASLIPNPGETDVHAPGYDVVFGSFDGDWLAAAGIYRTWAVKQPFCTESRFHNGLSPQWLAQTAFWVWNRGRSSNVLKEAEDFQARLGLPVNAYWHWWHGCAYDSGFPEYLPPREGAESFIEAVDHAHLQGIHSLVYMNSIQWGDSSPSYEDQDAGRFAARRKDGNTYRHVYEVFSGLGLTPMCMATPFWRDTYASLCDSVVNRYHVDGVYMDQACGNRRCYNPDHGHPLGGGSYWVDGFHELTGRIREKFPRRTDVMLGGEGSAEDWIPMLDDFLTLPVSSERYNGVSNREPVPLFQAIYHDYAMTFGNYSSLVYPPYDELWTKEFRPANTETLLPKEFNRQFLMEQARSFVWGMQPTLANYHSFLFEERKEEMDFLVDLVKTRYNALDYLLYGVMKDLQVFPSGEITIPIARISIYAGRMGDTVTQYEKTIPVLFSGVWRSSSGNLGIAVCNISDEGQELLYRVDAARYGIPSSGKVCLITSSGRQEIGTYTDKGDIRCSIPSRRSCVIELLTR